MFISLLVHLFTGLLAGVYAGAKCFVFFLTLQGLNICRKRKKAARRAVGTEPTQHLVKRTERCWAVRLQGIESFCGAVARAAKKH